MLPQLHRDGMLDIDGLALLATVVDGTVEVLLIVAATDALPAALADAAAAAATLELVVNVGDIDRVELRDTVTD